MTTSASNAFSAIGLADIAISNTVIDAEVSYAVIEANEEMLIAVVIDG